MTRPQKKRDGPSPGELLDLWMGHADPSPTSASRLPPSVVLGASLLGVVLTLAVARYAIDVLLVLAGLAALGLLLHLVGGLLADSDAISPGWVLALLVFAAVSAWALVPEHTLIGLGRYVPKPIVQAVEWLEERGLAKRALIGPADATAGPPAPPAVSPGVAATTGRPEAARISRNAPEASEQVPLPPVIVTASAPSTRAGERVVFMARLPSGAGATIVRFFDGRYLLGSAPVRQEGAWSIAYFPVSTLAVGAHDIRADAVSALGTGARSEPIRHVVR